MKIEEAIQRLKQIKTDTESFANTYKSEENYKDSVALGMAIEALSAETVEGVGRYENAMQKLREMPRYLNNVKAKQIKKISADKPHGEWINQDNGAFYPYECSNCHEQPFCDDYGYHLTNYCPNCGADMRRNGKREENNNVHKMPLYAYISWERSEE